VETDRDFSSADVLIEIGAILRTGLAPVQSIALSPEVFDDQKLVENHCDYCFILSIVISPRGLAAAISSITVSQ
jgi:hypothetical protein